MARATGLRVLDSDSAAAAKLRTGFLEAIQHFASLRRRRQWQDMQAASAQFLATASDIQHHVVLREILCEARSSTLLERARTLKREYAKLKQQQGGAVLARALQEAAVELEGTTSETLAQKFNTFRPSTLAEAFRSLSAVEGDPLRDAFIALRTIGYRAHVLGTYGRAYGTRHQLSPPSEQSPVAGLLGSLITSQQKSIGEAYKSLHHDIRRDLGLSGPIRVARDLEVSLRVGGGILAAATGTYVGSLNRAELTEAATDLAVSASCTLADAEVLYAFCSYLEAQAMTTSSSSWAHREALNAKKLSVATKLPRGTPVSIEQVLQGTLRKNQLYRVSGVIEGLRIADDPAPPKFSSFFQLKSVVTSASVPVRAHMFSLANNGLADGMLCVLEGRLAKASTWSPGIPALEIDRIDLGRLRRSSWTDDVVYRMRSYSKRYPDEMNMAFAPISYISPEVHEDA